LYFTFGYWHRNSFCRQSVTLLHPTQSFPQYFALYSTLAICPGCEETAQKMQPFSSGVAVYNWSMKNRDFRPTLSTLSQKTSQLWQAIHYGS